MSGPLPPLITETDSDWAKFKAGDDSFFVGAAAAEVRKYCNWHVGPSKVEDGVRREINRDGVILLKSLYVTAVASVVVDGRVLRGPTDPSPEYDWEECGLIYRTTNSWGAGYMCDPCAYVTFTHGYDELPMDIKQVIFELAGSAQEMPAGKVKSIGSIGFNYTFGELGAALSDNQKSRLADYRLESF